MKRSLLPLLFLISACSCAHAPFQEAQEENVREMLESTVQIEVQVAATVTLNCGGEVSCEPDQKTVEVQVTEGWVGSGVVYSKTLGLTGPVTSKILTANHVLEAPEVGKTIVTDEGTIHIDAVLMTVHTHSGKTCELQPLALGTSDTHDTATGLALCDAGLVATIADRVPDTGAKVIVTGHPLGIPLALVTEGYVSGWMGGYLLVSAGAAPGNSGGPVWYNGEVVGLLVRGAPQYPHISLVVPLKSIQERIDETP